jgi:hypothetical protein
MSYSMMIDYNMYDRFTMEQNASKNDIDNQNLLLATVYL